MASITGEALGIARSVRELPPEQRLLVRKLVDLMSAAGDDARAHAQTMIRETLTFDLENGELYFQTVDETIRYLEIRSGLGQGI